MGPDFYAVLGVAPDAEAEQITRAFRHLVRALHPDTVDSSTRGRGADDERLRQVLAAWRVLHDPVARAAYDQTRTAPATTPRHVPDSGGQPRRKAPLGDPDLIAGPTVIHAGPEEYGRTGEPPRYNQKIYRLEGRYWVSDGVTFLS